MLYNTSRNFDFPPELKLPGSAKLLNVIENTKLLGIQLTMDHGRMKISEIDPSIYIYELFS